MKARIVIVGLACLAAAWPAAGQTKCAAAREQVSSALQKAGPQATSEDLKDAARQLAVAYNLCPSLGDAYYYAALVYDRLMDGSRAEWHRGKARQFGSEAMKQGLTLEGTAVGAAGSSAETRVSATVRQRLALVVGVGRFKDQSINPLRFTSADARAIAGTLQDVCKFDYVKTLVDEEATSYNFRTEVERLARISQPEDLVVLYVSSHGSPQSADSAGISYIVTHDTEVNNLYATAFKMEDLLEDIRERIKAVRVVAFLDTCYSGGTFRVMPAGWAQGSRPLVSDSAPEASVIEGRLRSTRRVTIESAAAVNRVPQGEGRVVISSSSPSEKSWEDETLQHGYFTYYLLQAIREKTPISVEDLFDFVKTRVSVAVARDKGASQTPIIVRNRPRRVDVYLRDEVSAASEKVK